MTPGGFWWRYRPLIRFGQWRQRAWLAKRALADRRLEWWARWTKGRMP